MSTPLRRVFTWYGRSRGPVLHTGLTIPSGGRPVQPHEPGHHHACQYTRLPPLIETFTTNGTLNITAAYPASLTVRRRHDFGI